MKNENLKGLELVLFQNMLSRNLALLSELLSSTLAFHPLHTKQMYTFHWLKFDKYK